MLEETGLLCAFGPSSTRSATPTARAGQAGALLGDDRGDAGSARNDEVDEVLWLPVLEIGRLLTYDPDLDVVRPSHL